MTDSIAKDESIFLDESTDDYRKLARMVSVFPIGTLLAWFGESSRCGAWNR
ncbi:MAG: hypothetical protein MUC83_13990 [Pirellula sp.]|nr:hypothetical protein [Pirellula sp.]